MNATPPNGNRDRFESDLEAGLSRIADAIDTDEPPDFDPARVNLHANGDTIGRRRTHLVLVAAASAGLAVTGAVFLSADDGSDAIRSVAPATTSNDTIPEATEQLDSPNPAASTATSSTAATTTVRVDDSLSDPTPPAAPPVPTLEAIAAERRQALRMLPGFTATATITTTLPDADPEASTVRYTLLADGSFYADTGGGTFGSYDPSTGVVLGAFRDLNGVMTYQQIVGQADNTVPLGVLGGYDPTMDLRPDSSVVVSETEFDARPAWQLDYRDTYAVEGENEIVEETSQIIDRETGLIVSNSTTSSDPSKSLRGVELIDIEIVDTMPPEFPGAFPPDAEVITDGDPNGVQMVEATDVADVFGPTVPLPIGFLDEAARDGEGPLMITLTTTPSYLGEDDDGGGEPSVEYIEATFTVREGFVSTAVRISAQRLVGDASVPADYSVVDGFLCFDNDQDARCDDIMGGDADRTTLEAGALSERPIYVTDETTYVYGTVVVGGVNIFVSGADPDQIIETFESFESFEA